jgi:PAS domain S-box-containing protein
VNDSRLSDLLDISLIQTLADSNIRAGGLPMTIVDARDSSILVMSSWPEVCSDLHRDDPLSPGGCIADSNYIPDRFGTVDAFQYKCKYGLCHIAIPIIVAGRHMGTMFLTPFFFEDQLPELKQPAGQSAEAGFDKHGYLSTFDRIPVFNAEMVDYILAYDRALVHFIADLAERSLRVIETKKSPGESEERYRTLVYNLNLGIYRKNPDIGRFIRINSAMPKIFGYASDEEFLNVPSASLYQNPDDRIGFIEEITRHGFVKNIELQMKKKDGTPIWCSVTSSAKYTKNRKFKWIDSIIVDITERKKTEEGLIKAHHKLKIRVRERTSALANANDLLMAEIAERKKAE